MKKYRVSKFYGGTFVAGSLITGSVLIISITIADKFWVDYLVSAICLFSFGYCVYAMVFDLGFAWIKLSPNGLMIHIGFRKYCFQWSAFNEYGIVNVTADSRNNSTYWVYCSRRKLSPMERVNFLNKTRRERNNIAYFQYNKEPFEELLKYVPEEWTQRLRRQEEEMLERMRIAERLYHK